MATRNRSAVTCLLAMVIVACGDLPSEPEEATPDDPCSATPSITVGQSMTGSLNADDCVQPAGTYGDTWSLTLVGDTIVRINLTSPPFDGALELHDAFGNMLAYADDLGLTNARIIRPLRSGSYDVVVRSVRPGETGQYNLTVDDAPECYPRGTLQLGVPVNGALEADDCPTEWGDVMESWSLALGSPTKVRIDLVSSEFDEIMLIQDEFGGIGWGADWTHPSGHARLDAELPAGAWTLLVTSPSTAQRGAYTLSVDTAPPCAPGIDFVLGETVVGEITASDCLFDGWMAADSFGVVVADETPIDIHMKSADLEPLVILRDQIGRDVAVGWDQFQDGNARIRTSLPPGEYALIVTGYPGPGSYQLTVSEVECGTPSPITLGQTVDGSLDADDCLRAGGAFREAWALSLPNDATVRIDLTSGSFDAYLVLEDGAGVVIASDDDGGAGLNSRIERALTAGSYVIVASSFADGQTGPYQLTVDAPPPTPGSSAAPPPDDDVKERDNAVTAPYPGAFVSEYMRRRVGRE